MYKHTESDPRLLCSNARRTLLNTYSLTPQHIRQTRNCQRNPIQRLHAKQIYKYDLRQPLSADTSTSRKKHRSAWAPPINRSTSTHISILPRCGNDRVTRLSTPRARHGKGSRLSPAVSRGLSRFPRRHPTFILAVRTVAIIALPPYGDMDTYIGVHTNIQNISIRPPSPHPCSVPNRERVSSTWVYVSIMQCVILRSSTPAPYYLSAGAGAPAVALYPSQRPCACCNNIPEERHPRDFIKKNHTNDAHFPALLHPLKEVFDKPLYYLKLVKYGCWRTPLPCQRFDKIYHF